MASKNDSHLSMGKETADAVPMKQHHRMAMGEKVNGQTNPNGAESGSKTKMVKPSNY